MRLLRTEMLRIRSDAQIAKYKENGFTYYVWFCEPGACKICSPYDDQVFKVSEGGVSATLPPLHPHCRCSTYGRIDYDMLLGKSKVFSDILLESAGEKVYNQGMFSMDLMAKQRSFTVGNDIRVKTKRLSGNDFDFWV